MNGTRYSSLRLLGTSVILVATLATTLVPLNAGAVTLVRDPERVSTSLTAWAWYYGATPATLTNAVSAGYRIIDLEVESTTPKFSAALVKNSGGYARTWWWYYGLTASQVASRLSTNGARLIDIERYVVSGSVRYAVVMVKNSGSAAKTWWYYYGQTVSSISSKLSANNARLIDIDAYSTSNGTRYNVIMIRNAGVDASAWWWYVSISGSQVSSYLKNNGARLIDLERNSTGTFNVIMIRNTTGAYWWWYYGKSASGIGKLASQNGARIVDIESYLVNGVRYFAAVMVNNVNAETSRLREIMRAGLSGGTYGVYVKRVGASTYVDLQKSVVFEPASMIKLIHFVTALEAVQAGDDLLTDDVTWYVLPTDPARYPSSSGYSDDKNKCAYESDGDPITTNQYTDDLGNVILRQMMEQSDNRTTDATYNRYGRAAINAVAAAAGMSKTELYHRIGCPAAASDQPYHRNELTLYDAGLMYERVDNGTQLGTGAVRDAFFDLIAGGAISSTGALANVIKQEGASLGKSSTVVNQFIANTFQWSKGGSYDQCPSSGACSPPYYYVRTAGGILRLPHKNSTGTIVPVKYVYGRFVDKLLLDCAFKTSSQTDATYASQCPAWKKANDAMSKVSVEMFRARIRSALATW